MAIRDNFQPGEVLLSADLNDTFFRGFMYRETVYFTSNGTFTKADYPWLRAVRVRVQGGGGGGGGIAAGTTDAAASSGGGGGGYAESIITDIAGLSASVTVTRGSGGTGGAAGENNGSNGGNSSFGSLVVGLGGGGGLTMIRTTVARGCQGGAPGGGTGNFVIEGARGVGGYVENSIPIGATRGGDSHLGHGAGHSTTDFGHIAQSADVFGGGGSGSARRGDATPRPGGDGGDGIVIVELYA